MYHYRKTKQSYNKLNAIDKKHSGCSFAFCDQSHGEVPVKETETMYVISNRVSYDVFEGRKVLDHLMITPKRHVEHIKDFTDQEKLEMMSLAGEYEALGYNVYARGQGSVSRSVQHQHTHLIKTSNERARAVLYTRKPYFLLRA